MLTIHPETAAVYTEMSKPQYPAKVEIGIIAYSRHLIIMSMMSFADRFCSSTFFAIIHSFYDCQFQVTVPVHPKSG